MALTAVSGKSDTIGAIASTLCLIHCLATPFLFVVKTCSASCCASAPSWWKSIDYAFLAIALFAVYKSTRTSTKTWIKYALWISWVTLAFVLLNEQVHWINLHENSVYIPAIALVSFHIYNLKFCQCQDEACCVN